MIERDVLTAERPWRNGRGSAELLAASRPQGLCFGRPAADPALPVLATKGQGWSVFQWVLVCEE